MSASPVFRRSSNASGSLSPPSTDGLVNWYEAEEERIINLLSRKLEQLREEKIALENTLEAESESQVNRLNRELSVLRRQQQQQQQSQSQQGGQNGVDAAQPAPATSDPRYPSSEIMLDAMRRENESLRTRLMDIENDYIRMRRLNEVYREELIEHRRRLGVPIDNLVGLASTPLSPTFASDPLSQPIHRRSSGRHTSNPRTSLQQTSGPSPPTTATTASSSFSSSPAAMTFSPPVPAASGSNPLSSTAVSNNTNLTTPPSASSLTSNPPMPYPLRQHHLSYPSVPPPSLSSSLGSPILTGTYHPSSYNIPSPISPIAEGYTGVGSIRRRGSSSARIAETGSLRELSESRSRSPRPTGNASPARSASRDSMSGTTASGGSANTSPASHSTSRPIPILSRGGTPVVRP